MFRVCIPVSNYFTVFAVGRIAIATICQSFLQYLKDARLELKQKYKETGDKKYHAQQNAFKILINGGYGFSGKENRRSGRSEPPPNKSVPYYYASPKLMIETLESFGAAIIEVDTDGIFFSHAEPGNCLEVVQRKLPNGIQKSLQFRVGETANISNERTRSGEGFARRIIRSYN